MQRVSANPITSKVIVHREITGRVNLDEAGSTEIKKLIPEDMNKRKSHAYEKLNKSKLSSSKLNKLTNTGLGQTTRLLPRQAPVSNQSSKIAILPHLTHSKLGSITQFSPRQASEWADHMNGGDPNHNASVPPLP